MLRPSFQHAVILATVEHVFFPESQIQVLSGTYSFPTDCSTSLLISVWQLNMLYTLQKLSLLVHTKLVKTEALA